MRGTVRVKLPAKLQWPQRWLTRSEPSLYSVARDRVVVVDTSVRALHEGQPE